jgi:PAS domain S-box-containing protein
MNKTKKQLTNELEKAHQQIDELEKVEWVAKEWRNLFDSITDFVSFHDKDFKIVRANKALCDYVGITPKELIGKHCYKIFHGTEEPIPDCPHVETMKFKKTVIKEFYEPKFNSYFMVVTSPIFDERGDLKGSVHIVRNISDRKKIEDVLRQKESIIESASSSIATADLEGKMTYGNPCFMKKWGFDDASEFLGKPFPDYWIVEDILDEIMENLHNKGKWFGEIKAKRKDGKLFDVQVSAAMVYDNTGKPVALMSTSIDVSERKEAEEEREKLIGELKDALAQVKTLSGLIPICSSCQKIRDDKGYWNQVADYISTRSEAEFTHGFCPDCAENFKKKYPEYFKKKDN